MKLFYNNENNKLMDAFLQQASNKRIFIATAFFSNSDIIKRFIDNECTIKLIIRLNKGTSPSELENLIPFMESNKIEIRFFSDEHFHPKFYIFDDTSAFIGSSNLTHRGINENQEMNIQIEDLDSINELKQVFNSYWSQAKILTNEEIKKFKDISRTIKNENEESDSKKIKDAVGDISYSNYNSEDFMFYCTGDGPHRNYEDYIKYSFISAGQIKRETNFLYSKEFRNLKSGKYFFAYYKRKRNDSGNDIGGYVGFGKILEDPVPIDKFLINGKKIYELPLIQPNIKENHDNKATEWIAKVEWIKNVSPENAYYFPGIFSGSRHTVCKIDKIRHKETLDYLFDKFNLL